MSNSKRLRVGHRIRINKFAPEYKRHACSDSKQCNKVDCFMHHSNCSEVRVVAIVDEDRVLTSPHNLCYPAQITFSQIDDIFDVISSYQWRKI